MSNGPGLRTLVADDDPVSRTLLAHQLSHWGYQPETVDNGHQALRALQRDRDRPAIALLDWMMPGLDGIELCRQIRERSYEPSVYCILLTGRDRREDRLLGLEAGADDYLTKPIDLAELMVRLRAGKRVAELERSLISTRERLRLEATLDPLTGIYNRQGFAQALTRESARSQRAGRECAAIMADVDFFKRINDSHGHAAGDAALRRVAAALRDVVRPYDALGRFGGEEFAVFLPDCSAAQAAQVAERMRQAVAQTEDQPVVTCSFGVAAGRLTPGQTVDELLGAADRALYAAKADGRNRVARADGQDAAPRVSEPSTPSAPATKLVADRADLIVDAIPLAIWVARPDGSTEYVNRRWGEYTGWGVDKLLGWDWTPLLHPDDLEETVAHWQQAVASGENFERQIRFKSAQHGAFRVNLARALAQRDASGQVVRWFGAITDIHEQVLMERAAHDLGQRLKAVFANTHVVMWSVDADGVVGQIEGHTAHALPPPWQPQVGQHLLALPSFAELDQGRLGRALDGSAVHFEVTVEGRCFETFYAPMTAAHSGAVTGVAAMVIESTERRERQRMLEMVNTSQQIARQKSSFLARISHEIRTPMNGVLGMVEMLLDTGLKTEQRRFASTIQACGKHLVEIINDVLDLSKIEAGKLVLASRPFDLAAMIEAQVHIFVAQALQKGLVLSSFVDPRLPSWACGDGGRLAQILLNLIGNAVKFTAKGSIVTRAQLARRRDNAFEVAFSVSDTGPGIPLEVQEAIFSAYRQEEAHASGEIAGTGLGLAICRHLVEAMGGSIQVASRPQAGATFSFRIWLQNSTSNSAVDKPDLAGQRILVVEDDPVSCAALCAYLGAWGGEALVARNAAEALQQADSAQATGLPLDIAIIDRMLPDNDGYALRSELARRPGNPRHFTILTTAWERSGEATAALRHGFGGYLAKPFRRQDLAACLAGPRVFESPANPALSVPSHPTPQLTSCRVLVAEDNRVNQVVVTAALKKLGIAPRVVANGREALDALAQEPHDIVLMDCQMPHMDGIEATRRWRSRERTLDQHIPIIALTASALPEDVQSCQRAGMDDFLPKPIDPARLAAVLAKWFDHSRRTRSSS